MVHSFSIAAILVGFAARVLLPELINQDTELALPLLALKTLPTFFVGIILAFSQHAYRLTHKYWSVQPLFHKPFCHNLNIALVLPEALPVTLLFVIALSILIKRLLFGYFCLVNFGTYLSLSIGSKL